VGLLGSFVGCSRVILLGFRVLLGAFGGLVWLFLCILLMCLGTPYAFSDKTFFTYQKNRRVCLRAEKDL
jgi:hypothetical protein